MSKLYLVPTPIGNLEDITLRAIRILKEVDYVLAEDTRTSGFLLKHFDIDTKMYSHHKFNEHKSVEHIADKILGGESYALISDAGTPSISDPGFLLVKTCVEKGVNVECLPGATAFVPALAVSGLPSDRFCFEGFLPQKKGRNKKVQALVDEERTMIFYESPFRLLKAIELFIEFFGEDRQASVSREISKIHEENVQGTLKELHNHFSSKTIKGEIVIVVGGKSCVKTYDV
ncbi:MAG: 16S rRNA (cytidine(1402)-2'-O)-methyltransferase [Bacteroidales bacterium]|nr:16S rRNA (cytidine(1402)-2'-O)-methyltransferase [Bacteroidales bacterium]